MFSSPWRASLANAARRRPFPPVTHTRLYTSPPPPPPPSSYLQTSKKVAKYTGLLCLSSVVGVAIVGVGILAHDVFTYNDKHVDRVPVNALALHPERGGPKNLPIARVLVGDEEDEEAKALMDRPKLVIIGGGWGVRPFPNLVWTFD